MGRRNKNYFISLRQQAHNKLISMQAFGTSKSDAKTREVDYDKIFSYNTYQTYWKHVKYFVRWIGIKHPDCTTLKSARKHVNEWLQERVDQGLSAWTIQTEAKAIGKLFNIRPDDPNYFKPPKRNRKDIKRSRVDAVRDRHFSVTNNDELIKFCKGVGCRRAALAQLKGEDLWTRAEMEEELRTASQDPEYRPEGADLNALANMREALMMFPDQEYFVHFIRDKGGRSRFSPIIGKHKNQIIERMINTIPGKKVWEHIPTNADIHSYRAAYANAIYKKYSRDVNTIPYNETIIVNGKRKKALYVCRRDEAKKKLDRAAMIKCSKALGHNRESVVADNYLRGI